MACEKQLTSKNVAFYCYIRLYWLCVAIYGCVWLNKAICGCIWLCMDIHGCIGLRSSKTRKKLYKMKS